MDDSVTFDASNVGQLVGHAKAFAPEPEQFRAVARERQFGALILELVATGTVRVRYAAVRPARVPHLILFRVVRGALAVSRPGHRYTVAAGESVLFLSPAHYDFVIADGEYTQASLPLAQFSATEIATALGAVDSPIPPGAVIDSAWLVLDALRDAAPAGSSDQAERADSSVETLARELMMQVATNTPPHDRGDLRSPLLVAAFLYIELHLTDTTLDITTLTSALGTSERTLHREFRAIGTTPIAALREARLTAIATRLESRASSPTLETLAHEYGYADRTALSRAFRRRFGISPGEHRRRALAQPLQTSR